MIKILEDIAGLRPYVEGMLPFVNMALIAALVLWGASYIFRRVYGTGHNSNDDNSTKAQERNGMSNNKTIKLPLNQHETVMLYVAMQDVVERLGKKVSKTPNGLWALKLATNTCSKLEQACKEFDAVEPASIQIPK